MKNTQSSDRRVTPQTLPDVEEIAPISKDDEECLQEIREVLSKHGKLSRFGITLLHQHFPVAEDEILLERCDPDTRTLTIRPTKKTELNNPLETSWRLDIPDVLLGCEQVCEYNNHFCHSSTPPEEKYTIGEGWS